MDQDVKTNMIKSDMPWHCQEIGDTLSLFQSSSDGLSLEQAKHRLLQFGPNVLPRAEQDGPLRLIWNQINNPLIFVLLASAGLAIAMGKILDGIVVLGVVVLNAIIGFIQEYKAGKAIDALSQLVPENTSVRRSGFILSLPAAELVPGDVVLIASGDKIPADLRLMSSHSLRIDESALTGESVPVSKKPAPLPQATAVADRVNMAYSGTLATYGTAEGVVISTGLNTELGRISAMLTQAIRLETPLTRALEKVSKFISLAIVIISVILLFVGLLRGYSLVDSLLAAISLAVAAIPEGLPAIITIALAIGVKRMAKRNAIIRHLPAVETLGSTTVICTDKTGTLTKNEMTVRELWCDGETYEISGVGYAPEGKIFSQGQPLAEIPSRVTEMLRTAALCNDAALRETDGVWTIVGDPTEGALITAAEKTAINVHKLRHDEPRLDAVPFESERRFMATLNERSSGERRLYLKGAPEVLLDMCADVGEKTDSKYRSVMRAVEQMASRGMRVLAFASSETEDKDAEIAVSNAKSHLSFLGLQGLIDPPRPEAISAVRACHAAGITVKMVTGDHQGTALAVGRELGIEEGAGAIAGIAIDGLSDEDFHREVSQTNILARVAPEHKLRLVRALQDQGQIVAMTGDGVNDAPALKQANIGVAMGVTGTAVSREAADIVLTDDNFSSIAAAVEEGRRVYDNLTKSLAFVLPTNLGEAMIILVAVLFFPMDHGTILMPITPVQILWVNLVATVALALPLAFEAMEPNIMSRPPRNPKAPLLNRFVIVRTVIVTILITIGGVGLFHYEFFRELAAGTDYRLALSEAQTMAVTSVILMQIFYLFNCRSLRSSILQIGLFTNNTIYIGIAVLIALQLGFIYLPFMNLLFGSAPLNADGWLKTTLCAITVLPIISLEKRISARC